MQPADVLIAVIFALIVFGPKKKWPQVAAELGQALRELREITRRH